MVNGPWKLSSFSTAGNVTMVPNKAYSGSPKPKLAAIKFVPFTADSAEYTALKTGQVDVGVHPAAGPAAAAGQLGRCRPPIRWAAATTCSPFYSFGIYYAQPNFNNPQVGFMVRQLYMRQALQMVFDQPGIDKAIWRGYAVPTSGPAPNTPPGNQWPPPVQKANGGQGPYPFNVAKAKSLLTSHGWTMQAG